MKNLKTRLTEFGACSDAKDWVEEKGFKTLEEAWGICERGNWMLWLMKKANLCDIRTLTLAKARCAELAKPYMKDPRSLAALQAAFDFAEGRIDAEQLRASSAAAYAAAYADASASSASASSASAAAAAAAAYAAYADASAFASASADASAFASAYADASAASADASASAFAAYADARIRILKQCADICREVLPNPKFSK